MDWHFWLYMLIIAVGSLIFQLLIRLPYMFTTDESYEDEGEEAIDVKLPQPEKLKEKTEKELFIEAYIGMFNDTNTNAEHAYKTTDSWSRKILIDQYNLQHNHN